MTKQDSIYSVFVGGGEVNSFLLTKEEAEKMADMFRKDGYDDVAVVNMNEIKVKDVELPFFPGFYNSFLELEDSDIDEEINYLNEYYPCDKEITYDDLDIDYDAHQKVMVDCFVEAFEEYLPSWVKSIEMPELDSPKEYNFRTDKIYVTATLTDDWKEQMQEFVKENREWLTKRIKDDWSDRSGFWSFIKNDIDAFLMNLYELDSRYVSIMMGYAIELKNENEDMYDMLTNETLELFWQSHSTGEFIRVKNETEHNTEEALNTI